MSAEILVTGGAGYIGSHAVRMLLDSGRKVAVVDDLSCGHRGALPPDVSFYEGNIGDEELLEKVFGENDISAVMHFAAFIAVGESVSDPAKYYRNNFAAPLALLDAMRTHDCRRFVFSSTAATYGDPEYIPIDEEHAQRPINPYGMSKWMLETALRNYENSYGLCSVFLRYFNVAGASGEADIGEDHDPETHLIPLILQAALGIRENISIFGIDYDTPDGSCIRDYIHVEDLCDAHLLALKYLESGGDTAAFNLGTGAGYSVREMIEAAKRVTGVDFCVVEAMRRAGDPPRLVADPAKAKKVLGWRPKYDDIEEIIRSAWSWMTGPRKGHFER